MTSQVKMITEAVNEIQSRTNNCDTKRAFSTLVSYTALKIGVDGAATEAMSVAANMYLMKNFDTKVLKEKTGDWFTDAAEELGLIKKADHENLKDIRANILRAIRTCKEIPLMPLFIPPQTSRLILMTFEKLGNEAVYVGLEPDIIYYHVALVNSKLYQIPCIMLNANPDIHAFHPGSKNWEFVNAWERPNWGKMEEL